MDPRRSFSEEERREIFRNDGWTCRACGCRRQYKDLEVDHIVPLSRRGTNDPDNLQTLCRECNREKGQKTMNEYLTWRDAVYGPEMEPIDTLMSGLGCAVIGGIIGGPPGAILGGIIGLALGSDD